MSSRGMERMSSEDATLKNAEIGRNATGRGGRAKELWSDKTGDQDW